MKVPTPEDPLRVVELFSGIGAQAMALKRLGIPYEVVGTSEIDRHAIASYEAIHGPVNQLGDITKLEHLPECDLVTYSFPCLTGDVKVLTAKGWVCIRDVEVGDCVYSHDGGYHRVIAAGCTGTKPTLTLRVEGHNPIRCTDNHLFRRRNKDGLWVWSEAGRIRGGDILRTITCDSEDGKPVYGSVKVLECAPNNYDEKVYDITVERTESFYIQGGVETHNCQDLSVAGAQRGMEKGSGTRSALLWEVGRLIEDAVNNGHAPECLVMENVPAILNQKNVGAFNKWIDFLTSLGYTSSYQILNATDFDVPQNRSRCFMVSCIEGLRFRFPTGHPTDRRLRDVLEDDVDESFFLSDEKIALYEEHKRRHDSLGHGLGWKPRTADAEARALTCDRTRHGGNFIITQGSMEDYRTDHEPNSEPTDGSPNQVPNQDAEPTVPACDPSDEDGRIVIAGKIPGSYDMAGRVYDPQGLAPTLTTFATGGNQMPKIDVSEPRIDVVGNIRGMKDQSGRVHGKDGYAPTVMANRFGGKSSLIVDSQNGGGA